MNGSVVDQKKTTGPNGWPYIDPNGKSEGMLRFPFDDGDLCDEIMITFDGSPRKIAHIAGIELEIASDLKGEF